MSAPGASRAERIKAGRAIEEARRERALPPGMRWALVALLVALLVGAAALMRSGFSEPLLSSEDLTNRLINPEQVAYDAEADAVALTYRGRTYRLEAPLWRDRSDGEALAAALPVGQGVMVWVPREDTALAVQPVMAVEAAALTVPVGAGLRAMQSPVRSSRWSGIVALLLAGAVAAMLISQRRTRDEI